MAVVGSVRHIGGGHMSGALRYWHASARISSRSARRRLGRGRTRFVRPPALRHRPSGVGDAIISIVSALSSRRNGRLLFALLLVCLKLMVGAFLLATVMSARSTRAALGPVRRRDARRRAVGRGARQCGIRAPRSDARRRDAQRDHRRADAVPDRERTCDLRPRLSGKGRAAAAERPEPVIISAA